MQGGFARGQRVKCTDLFHPNGRHKHRGQVLGDGNAIDALQEHVELHPLPSPQRRACQLCDNNWDKMNIM